MDWPPQFPRTERENRQPNNRLDTSLRVSIDDLAAELERVGADDWRLETAADHQKRNPNYSYADANPDDLSAVVRWMMDGDQYAAACDAYTRLRDNIRSLYLYIREKRKMDSRPVVTGESEFANAHLPPADDPVVAEADEPPHVVLGVSPEASPAEEEQSDIVQPPTLTVRRIPTGQSFSTVCSRDSATPPPVSIVGHHPTNSRRRFARNSSRL